MNLYIDIDGVLLSKQMKAPEGAEKLIYYVTSHYNCFWLTTHCRHGQNNALTYLTSYYPTELLNRLHVVNSTHWLDLKTEAIDLGSDFVWLEDYPFESEKKVLAEAGKLDSLLPVDLNRPQELKRILAILIDKKNQHM